MRTLSILLALFFSVGFLGCGARTPSNVKTAKIAKGYFQKYGKKYKDSEFGQAKVAQVEVKEVRELQKNVATSFLLVKLDNGTEIPVVMTLMKKQPTGWRTTSWEWASQ